LAGKRYLFLSKPRTTEGDKGVTNDRIDDIDNNKQHSLKKKRGCGMNFQSKATIVVTIMRHPVLVPWMLLQLREEYRC
jgi:hypothetical protein